MLSTGLQVQILINFKLSEISEESHSAFGLDRNHVFFNQKSYIGTFCSVTLDG